MNTNVTDDIRISLTCLSERNPKILNLLVNRKFICLLLFVLSIGLCPVVCYSQAVQNSDVINPVGQDDSINKDEVKRLLDKAQQAILRGDDIGADKYLSQVVDIAYKAWDLGDATTSESIFRQVLKLKSDYPKALFGLAELYRRMNPSWAIEYYTRYMRVNPGDPAAYFGRGTCYLMQQAYSLAIQDLKYLVDRLEPNHIQGLTNLALALRGKAIEQNYDHDLFKQAVEYMGRAVDAALQMSGQSKDIKALLPALFYRYGRLQFEYQQILAKANPEQADFSGAIQSLEKSIRYAKALFSEDKSKADAVNQIILSLDALTEVYNAITDINPKDSQAYIELLKLTSRKAYALGLQMKLLGLQYLKKGIEANAQDAQLWFLLSQQYVRLDMIKQAIDAINKALEISPNEVVFKKYKASLIASTQPTSKPAASGAKNAGEKTK